MELQSKIDAARLQRKLRASTLKNEMKGLLENVLMYEETYGPDISKYPQAEADLFMMWIKRAKEIRAEKVLILEAHEVDEAFDGIGSEIDNLLNPQYRK